MKLISKPSLPVALVMEDEDDFRTVEAALLDYAHGRRGHVDFRRIANRMHKRLDAFRAQHTDFPPPTRPWRPEDNPPFEAI